LFLMKSSCISILRQVRSLFRRQES
jgi:hypothetical protein